MFHQREREREGRQRNGRGRSTEADVQGCWATVVCAAQWRVLGGPGGTVQRRLEREVVASESLSPRISLRK